MRKIRRKTYHIVVGAVSGSLGLSSGVGEVRTEDEDEESGKGEEDEDEEEEGVNTREVADDVKPIFFQNLFFLKTDIKQSAVIFPIEISVLVLPLLLLLVFLLFLLFLCWWCDLFFVPLKSIVGVLLFVWKWYFELLLKGDCLKQISYFALLKR